VIVSKREGRGGGIYRMAARDVITGQEGGEVMETATVEVFL